MKLVKANFSKAELDALPDDDQIFFVQLAHLLDELSLLTKCLIFSSNAVEKRQGVRLTALRAQSLFFVRTIAGKAWEGWQMLQESYFSTSLRQKYDDLLPSDAKESLDRLAKYFGRPNLINQIRNKYAFHYDREKVRKELQRIDQDEVLSMVISEHQSNNLFSFSDTVVTSSLLHSIDPNSPQSAMQRLIDEIVCEVCKWFQDFGYHFVRVILDTLRFRKEDVNIDDVCVLHEVELPHFVRKGNQGL